MWRKLGLLRPDRRGLHDAGPLSERRAWIKYAVVALAIHAALLSLPVYHKAVHFDPQKVIGVILTKEEPAPVAIPKHVEKAPLPPRVVTKRPPGGSRPAPMVQPVNNTLESPKIMEKPKEEPQPAGPGNMADKNSVASLPPAPIQANDEGVGTTGATGGRGKVGPGGGGSGSGAGTGAGGSGTGGQGTGTGVGSGAGSGAITPLQFLHKVMPEYPPAARKRNKEGKVDLVVWVDEKGSFVKADVLDASSQVFVQPSIEAARNSTYPPSEKKGLRKGSVSYAFVLE